jgi:hypothetical protein
MVDAALHAAFGYQPSTLNHQPTISLRADEDWGLIRPL